MELKVGMYVRTKRGTIFKIIDGNVDKWYIDIWYYQLSKLEDEDCISYEYNKNDNLFCSLAKKTSENIIDLIEKKDIILGKDGNIYEVSKVLKGYVYTKTKTKNGLIKTLVDYQIDKVLTHEQFENNAYGVE